MKNILEEIKKRYIRKWLGYYISAAITIIGFVHLMSLRYNIPSYIFDLVLLVLVFGIFTTLVVTWFHGEKGKQKTKKIEYLFHTIILFSAIAIAYFFIDKSVKILDTNSNIIAVLPFTNMSNSNENDYFCDGITEDILTQLSKIGNLKVISRTSVMKYKNTKLSLTEIANELGVGSILEGSVRQIGNKVRITGQLINANSDEHLWAETYDRTIDDVFKVQSEIAKKIALELKIQLTENEQYLIDTEPTESSEAYALYLRGRNYYYLQTEEDNNKAMLYFKNAIKLDSTYALAYAGLAKTYDQNVRKWSIDSQRDSSLLMAKKALSINPKLAEAQEALAANYFAIDEVKLAEHHYKKAIDLKPNFHAAIYNLGTLFFNQFKFDKALVLVEKSIQLQPDHIFGYVVLGMIYAELLCDNKAIELFEKALSLAPNHGFTLTQLSKYSLLNGNIEKATKYLNILSVNYPKSFMQLFAGGQLELVKQNYKLSDKYWKKYETKFSVPPEYLHGYIYKKIGKIKEANKIIENEIKDYSEYQGPQNLSIFSEIYAVDGNKTKALETLEKAVNSGWINYRRHLIFPFMNEYKNDNKFKFLINKMKSKVDSIKNVLIENNEINFECF